MGQVAASACSVSTPPSGAKSPAPDSYSQHPGTLTAQAQDQQGITPAGMIWALHGPPDTH
jgi:hypothetical protein